MKTQRLIALTIQVIKGATVTLGVLAFAGCVSTGYTKSDAAAMRLQTTAEEVRAESTNLDVAMTTLNDLVTNASGDLKVQFGRFSRAVDQLADCTTRTSGHVKGLQRDITSYFETWEKELPTVQDDQVRHASAARKAVVSTQYKAALRRYEETQISIGPLVTYLQDIRKALSTDLTLAGLQAVKQPVAIATDRATKAKADLAISAAELTELSAKMSSTVPTKGK